MASPRNDSESSPLLTPPRTESPHPERTTFSSLLSSNLFGGPGAWVAQAGLVLFVVTLWKVLYEHPAGLFTYHPAFNSLAIAGFTQGVLLLQPTKTRIEKRKGFQLHQVFQYTALPLILAGTWIIIYNKILHSAPHFASTHGKFGIVTLSWILVQITFGAFMVYAPLVPLLGGEEKAKKLWKFHRISGYTLLTLLYLTPLLAISSPWTLGNSSLTERVAMRVGLGMVPLGLVTRIRLEKLGLK